MSLRLIGSGVADDDAIIGYFGDPALQIFGENLFASYMLGNEYPLDLLKDYTQNGHDLTIFGSPTVSDAYTDCSNPNGFNAPFNISDWADGGAITAIGIVRRPTGTQGRVIFSENSNGNAPDSASLLWTTALMQASHKRGGTSWASNLTDTAFRSTGFEMQAGVWTNSSVRVYRRYDGTGGALTEGTATATPTDYPAGSLQVMLGSSRTAGTTNSRLVAVAFIRGNQSALLEDYYQAARSFYADYGVTV